MARCLSIWAALLLLALLSLLSSSHAFFVAAPARAVLFSSPSTQPQQRQQGGMTMMGGKVAKFGIFSPAVIVAKVLLGEQKLNKVRDSTEKEGGRKEGEGRGDGAVFWKRELGNAIIFFQTGQTTLPDDRAARSTFLKKRYSPPRRRTRAHRSPLILPSLPSLFHRSEARPFPSTPKPSPSSATLWAHKVKPVTVSSRRRRPMATISASCGRGRE